MKVGYVRVSTVGQNTARQEIAMDHLGIEKIFIDKVSGKDKERPELKKMIEFVRDGDMVIVESISRFARNVKDLLDLVSILEQKKVSFVSIKENIDTSTSMGKFLLTVFGAIAQLERDSILERQREGIEIAKSKGKYAGRKPKSIDNFNEIYESWINNEITVTSASQLLGISRSTFYRKANIHEKEINGNLGN